MKVSQPDRNVIDLTMSCKSSDEGSIMLMTDVHFDSIKCDVPMFERHLAHAEAIKAPVIIGGDLFDAMQGHDDPRRSLEELKKEYKHENYLDLLVLDVAKCLLQYRVPYFIGLGNHETAVQHKVNTNLTERLCYAINSAGGTAHSMGYWGFFRLFFRYDNGRAAYRKQLYWHHGSGAAAPITRGVLETVRQSSYLPDADVILNGHNHQEYVLTLNRIKVNEAGIPYEEYQHFVRTPGYKKAGLVSGDRHGFDIERHPAPTTRGCVRLDWRFHKNKGVEFIPVALLS
jgi:hypothetical protein